MRIKKPHNKTNQDITFDTIADRNEAIKTLIDGDLVKVSDASDDLQIQSGWAVYRFCFETQSFDLIEQQEKENDSSIVKFETLMDFEDKRADLKGDELVYIKNLDAKDYNPVYLDVRSRRNYYEQVVTPDDDYKSEKWGLFLNSLERQVLIPLQIGDILPFSVQNAAGRHTTVVARSAEEINKHLSMTNKVGTVSHQRGITFVLASNIRGNIRGDLSTCDINLNGFYFEGTISHRSDFAMYGSGYPFTMRNGDIKLLTASPFLDSKRPLQNIFFEGIRFLNLDLKNNLLLKTNYEMGGQHVHLRSCSFVQKSSTDQSIDVPIKLSFSIGVAVTATDNKLVTNGKTRNSKTILIDQTYGKGTSVSHDDTFILHPDSGHTTEELIGVNKDMMVDNKTIVKNDDQEICSFHELNHGAGFEFPEHIKLNLNLAENPDLSFSWDGLKNGVDVFKYKNIQHPLGLRTARLSGDFLKTQCDTLGFTHYVRFSCFTGYTYWSSTWDYSSELPSLKEFDKSGKNYLPIAICKLVFNPDYSLNLSETQISHIYRNGVLIEAETPATETPDLQKVTDKGYRTTNRMVIRRDGVNSYGHTIEDETGSAKHSQNILGYAGHYELSGKDKSIGISLNGEGVADFKKSVSTAALKVKTGAAAGKIAVCQDAAGNVVWQDMPSFTALRGMKPEYLILKDFDFDIEVSGLTVKLIPRGLDGAKRFIEVSGPMGASMRANRFFQINKVEKTLDFSAGKPLYFYSSSQCNLSKTIPPTSMGAQNNFTDWTKQPTIRIIGDSAKIFAVRVNPPSDGANLKTSDITIYKIWKNHLAPFDELMDYRIANP